MPMTEREMIEALADCGRGSVLFVSYKAGRPPTGQAVLESERATLQEGLARRHYVGTFESLWMTRKGEVVLTIMAYNRDRVVDSQLVEGGYRTMNPQLGELYSLEVIEARPKDQVQSLYEMSLTLPYGDLRDLALKLAQLVERRKEET
jgi:hypothetical protein